MNERGMKKWAPFKSLNSHHFSHTIQSYKEKPLLLDEQKDKINYFLSHPTDDVYEIVVFQNGEIRYIYSSIVKIYREEHKIKLDNNKLLDIFSIIDMNIS